ncbi:MAG: YcjX family protein [Alphaproteobacteria bacterium]|nr:YcjX family protein [Alphaproteobacteria bacterium]
MAVSDYLTPTIRLGVTGLSRSGKTVFITALVRCLTESRPQPPFASLSAVPGWRGFLEPQPDDDVPRFSYEDHLAALSGDPAQWPESTRTISQLRLTLEWPPQDFIREAMGLSNRLHIDIIDYPGEWLIDLGLLNQTYEEWSKETLFAANGDGLAGAAEPFLSFLKTVDGSAAQDEQVAIEGARLYTEYITKARADCPSRAALGPGRFLLPGDLEGSPQLTFFPCNCGQAAGEPAKVAKQGTGPTMAALLARRFEKYKQNIVQPFFEKHFSRLDRQIVLVDVLSALNGGAEALGDLEQGLDGVMAAFRPGANSWLSFILPRRIDRIVFAATKADHIHNTSHDRLEAILGKAVARAGERASSAGADFRCIALAALRATEDVDKAAGDETFHCIRGVPRAGERVSGKRYDGQQAGVVFPGDLPRDPLDAFDATKARPEDYSFVRFQPPIMPGASSPWGGQDWPHIGMEKAIAFLFEDYLK